MKHTKKKKKRSRPPNQTGAEDAARDKDKEELGVLNSLVEAFPSDCLEDAVSVHREAHGDPDKPALIPGGFVESVEDRSTDCSSLTGSSWLTSSSNSSNMFVEDNCDHNGFYEKGSKGCKSKKVVAATGTVSTFLGKDYVRSTSKKVSLKSKWYNDGPVSNEDAEQFLCSMLGDECELSMAVVRDVLCQCRYDVEKALNLLLELSASSSEQSKGDQHVDYCVNNNEDSQFSLQSSDNFISWISDLTSHSSESELQDNVWSMGYHRRNYCKVLTDSEAHVSRSPGSSKSELPQMVLESLFNMPKSSEHEPNAMNWRDVVKKMESLGQRPDFHSSGSSDPQQDTYAEGDDYHVFRKAANQHWDAMKSFYQKAATAYKKGERDYAAYLSEQGRLQNKMAREADEKASQHIFNARNKKIENVITIDLHGQHVKQAMRLLKLHLLFGAYVRSVQSFRVITGCGIHGAGRSKLKQSVIDLVSKEGIECTEENRGTLLIRLKGQNEFSFLDFECEDE